MANLSLVFDILARDRASKEFKNVGDAVDDTGKKASKFGPSVAAGAAVAGAAVLAFGKSSVSAYVESEQASVRLDEALKKFPATNDKSRESFDKLNEALAKKTRFDDDATASAQAVLAQFELTGAQIQELTPLVQDYAAKTGRDLPEAATLLGKALSGNAKALKEVGINLGPATDRQKELTKAQDRALQSEDKLASSRSKLALLQATLSEKEQVSAADKVRLQQATDAVAKAEENHAFRVDAVAKATEAAGKPTGRFADITGELRKQVGGFATTEGKTAAGQAEILKNRFGEVQEQVGAKLTPALTALAAGLIQVIDFVDRNSKVIVPLVAVLGTLAAVIVTITTVAKAYTAVQTALNIVLAANPVGLIVVAVAALVAGLVVAYQKSETFRDIVNGAFNAVKTVVLSVVNFQLGLFDKLLAGFEAIARAAGNLPGPLGAPFRKAADAIEGARDKVQALRTGIDTLKGKEVKIDADTSPARRATDALVAYINSREGQIRIAGVTGLGGVTERAGGGPLRANQLSWVGERGPELVSFPRAAYVHSNTDSLSMIRGADDESVLSALRQQNALLEEQNGLLRGLPASTAREAQSRARQGTY